jgi:hypothetical protein
MKPILGQADLPLVGEAFETGGVDFKGKIDESDHRELAKDVAALANSTGGTVLVGAFEDGGRLGIYKPMDSAQAARIKDAYERSVRDLCSPSPVIDVSLVHLLCRGYQRGSPKFHCHHSNLWWYNPTRDFPSEIAKARQYIVQIDRS